MSIWGNQTKDGLTSATIPQTARKTGSVPGRNALASATNPPRTATRDTEIAEPTNIGLVSVATDALSLRGKRRNRRRAGSPQSIGEPRNWKDLLIALGGLVYATAMVLAALWVSTLTERARASRRLTWALATRFNR